MIKKLLLATASICLSATAFAADLPSRRAPPVYAPPPIPVFSWTGFYVGGQVGFAFGRDRAQVSLAGTPLFGYASNRLNGIIGGGHVGYNFAPSLFGGSGLIFGIEGDVDGSDYRTTEDFGAPAGAPGLAFNRVRSEIQGSIRGRLGFALDRALFYATGGAAFGEFRSSYFGTVAGLGNDNFSHARVGWTVGGGVEYAITNNWSLRAEYRYSDFGRFTDNTTFIGVPLAVRHHETEQRAQVGFSYKFETLLTPVVARY